MISVAKPGLFGSEKPPRSGFSRGFLKVSSQGAGTLATTFLTVKCSPGNTQRSVQQIYKHCADVLNVTVWRIWRFGMRTATTKPVKVLEPDRCASSSCNHIHDNIFRSIITTGLAIWTRFYQNLPVWTLKLPVSAVSVSPTPFNHPASRLPP